MSIITPEFISNATNEETNRFLVQDTITELLRNHAKNLIASALEVEVNAVLGELNQNGIEAIRNGYLPAREITTAIGNVEVNVPRIRSKSCGEAVNFTSTLIPKYLRRSKSVSAWAAYAYLKGISEKNIASVLEVVLG
ncbi:transposase, mutator type, partial [mine drainage metagenome]